MEKPMHVDSVSWDLLLNDNQWNIIFEDANSGIISLMQSPFIAPNVKPMLSRMAVDIQYYTFKYILMGRLDPSILYNISYPMTAMFYGLILNRHAFINKLGTPPGIELDTMPGNKKFVPLIVDHDPQTDKKTESNVNSARQVNSYRHGIENAGYHPPTYALKLFDEYYMFLKILFIGKDEAARKFVNQSDQLIEFDLYVFMNDQVKTFNPQKNYWLDKDVPLEKMAALMRSLLARPGRLCPKSLENLSLTFYLKSLYYLERYFDPANPYQITLCKEALTYISNYYKKRRDMVSPDMADSINQQLSWFYWLPGTRDALQYRLANVKDTR